MSRWTVMLFALLMLAMTGAARAAGGSYDEEDPFDEGRSIERFRRLGGDLAQEQDVEFRFSFSDRAEAREYNAQRFANKLRRMGYPKATARPCARQDLCWLVIAPKRVRLDLKKNVARSKELDQLAADDYGRYDSWDCELFRQEDERMLGPAMAESNKIPTVGEWLLSFDKITGLQCAQMQLNLAAEAADTKRPQAPSRDMYDMMCTCVPERIKETQLALQPPERDATMSDAELTQRYVMPKIIQPCAAKMVRKMYREECPARAAANGVNAETYCGCMQRLVEGMSEADLAQLGLITSDYLPQLAQAKKNGTRPPDPPPLYAKFSASEAACR